MNLLRQRIRKSIADDSLQAALDGNAQKRTAGRIAAFTSLPDHPARRQRAHAVKADVVAHLDEYLAQFIEKATANGIQVHRAADSDEAIRIFLQIADSGVSKHRGREKSSQGSRRTPILIAKAKSMVSEEINFNHAMEQAGHRAVETDLGEYIVQLRGERPSHIITPAVHLRRHEVGRLFADKLGIPYTEDIPVLTNTARRLLREVFLTADIGISGVNFGVAETGMLAIVTNEGNGRMCTTVPPLHVALMGLERLVPTMDDLALFLSLLARSATGQKLSVYTSLMNSPRRPGQVDTPLERHLILLDNGRTRLANSELAEALYCIRCGACLNACPVFRELSGHAYLGRDGSIAPYPGPIGSVISPGMFGQRTFGQLAQASSLCGACKEACPVDIDLPAMLLRVRAGNGPTQPTGEGVGIPAPLKLGLAGFRFGARTSGLFALGQRLLGLGARLVSPRQAWLRIPAWTGWGYSKDFPRPEARPFRARFDPSAPQELGSPARTTQPEPVPAVQPAAVDPAEQFVSELTALGGKAARVSEKDLPARLRALLKEKGIDRVLADRAGAEYLGDFPASLAPDPSLKAGVTGVLSAIAETGSLVLVGGEGLPLTASLLPGLHVAVVRRAQIVPRLEEALRRPEVREASAAVIVTGPSRTADIEMTLTIGVHGPGELHVFLVD
jgi:L-lactate dehydrogenase complex protein LldF